MLSISGLHPEQTTAWICPDADGDRERTSHKSLLPFPAFRNRLPFMRQTLQKHGVGLHDVVQARRGRMQTPQSRRN